MKIDRKIIFTGALVVGVLIALFVVPWDKWVGFSSLWDPASADAKLIFTGLIIVGILSR